MKGYLDNIEEITKENTNFRKVLHTGQFMQLVVMSLKPGEDIGEEVHPDIDQFFRVEEGEGLIKIGEEEKIISEDMVAIVPAGELHNLTNNSDKDLKIYTIYTPAEHPDGTVHATKEEAMADEHHHH